MKVTTTFHKIRALKKKVKVIQGGQAAGKNYAIAQIIIEKAIEKKRTITVMSDTYDNLKDGAIRDFQNILENEGYTWGDLYNKSSHDLVIEDSIVQFRYISNNKEDAGKSKRRDILYINEANKIGWNVASTFIGRTHEDIYIDLNPDRETWVHTEVPKLKDESDNDISELIIVTWRDNEFCPDSEKQFIESRKNNKQWYQVYGLGLTGTYSDRRIYSYVLTDTIPEKAKRINSGMDFGVSPDPTVLINVRIDGIDLYVDEVFSENNLLPEKITGAERMAIVDKMEDVKFEKGWPIVADSSGRVSILDMRKHGYNVIAVKKYPGSVLDGIKKLRAYNLHFTARSKTLRKGAENWFWKVDENGNIIPEPDGHEPDPLAALRYVIMTFYRK